VERCQGFCIPLLSRIPERDGVFQQVPREPAIAEGYGFFEMPRLATSWEELLDILRNRDLNARSCTA
jgi:hypothetical protein